MKIFFISVVSFTLALIGCSKNATPVASNVTPAMAVNPRVTFNERNIDLKEHLNGFPYDMWRWEGSLQHKVLYFKKKIDGKWRYAKLELNETGSALETGKQVSDLDISSSLSFQWLVNKHTGDLYFTKDENNNEVFDLYRISKAGEVRRISKATYVAGYGFSDDGKWIAYSDRLGKEGSRFNIHLQNLQTGEDKIIASDSKEQQFTWGDLVFTPDGKSLLATTLTDGNRNKGNISMIDVAGGQDQKPAVLTDVAIDRTFPEVTDIWIDADSLLVSSNEKGTRGLFSLNVKTKEFKPVAVLDSDVERVVSAGNGAFVFLTQNSMTASLYRQSKDKAEPELLLTADADITLFPGTESKALILSRSALQPYGLYEVDLQSKDKKEVSSLDKASQEKLIHCKRETFLFDTFDKIPMSLNGKKTEGKIYGVLYTPKNPPPKEKQIVVIESFYGGGNLFETDVQVLCAAGISFFSPAPRGTSSISAEFEKANDGDMGGGEVLDGIYAAKFVSDKLGIPPERIGVYGHSHGGYEVLWHMTFPGEVNGHKASFPWGFGIAQAAYGSIKNSYDTSNVKQTVVKEGGDPADPEVLKRWEDRSPINHVDKLKGLVLLIHGSSDIRVPYKESVDFAAKAKELKKDDLVTFVTLQGAGHSFVSEEHSIEKYQAWFALFDRVLQKAKK